MKRDGQKASTAVHGPLGITYHPKEKANEVANCLENQFIFYDMCFENNERRVETRFQELFVSVDDTPLGKVRPYNIHKLVNTLKLRKTCRLVGIPREYLRRLPRRPLTHLIHLFNHYLRLSNFSKRWNAAKHISLLKLAKDPKFPQNLVRLASCPRQASYSKKLFRK
jgi:hypothetical protein